MNGPAPAQPATRPAWIVAASALVVLGLGIALSAMLEWNRLAETRTAAFEAAERMVRQLDRQLNQDLAATYALAALVRQGKGQVANFEAAADELLAMHAGVSALQLAPGGVVRQSVPLRGNEKAIGHNLLTDDARNKEARLAVATRRLTLAGPFRLIQGGEAVVGRLPVFLDDRFWGFTSALIKLPDYLRAVRIGDLERQGYSYRLWRVHPDTEQMQVFAQSTQPPGGDPITTTFEVPNGRWALSLTPVNGWWSLPRLALEALLVAALAAIAGWIALFRLKAEHALAERELQFRTLYESTPAMMHSIDPEGRIISVSDLWLDALGYQRAEVIGHKSTDFLTEASRRHAIEAVLPEFYRTGRVDDVRYQMRTKDGRIRDVVLSATSERDRAGRIVRSLAVIEDVTERLQAEAALRIAAMVFSNSHNGVMITDADGILTDVNPAFSRITGYERAEVIGRSPSLLRSDRHDTAFFARFWQALREDGVWSGEVWNRRKSGEEYPEILSVTAMYDPQGRLFRYLGVFTDISELKENENRLTLIAHYDLLTGLPNRYLLTDRMGQALPVNLRRETLLAVCYLDLDGFKAVNDRYGHERGDRVLEVIAHRLQGCLRAGDTVARLGGDEFVMLLSGLTNIEECDTVLQRVLAALSAPIPAVEADISASIGVTLYPLDEADPDTLLRHADHAMYRAKKTGKDRVCYFDPATE